jgi:hypothetical protein
MDHQQRQEPLARIIVGTADNGRHQPRTVGEAQLEMGEVEGQCTGTAARAVVAAISSSKAESRSDGMQMPARGCA